MKIDVHLIELDALVIGAGSLHLKFLSFLNFLLADRLEAEVYRKFLSHLFEHFLRIPISLRFSVRHCF